VGDGRVVNSVVKLVSSFLTIRVTKFAGVIVVKLGPHRQLARPLSAVQYRYLTALDVPATYFTLPAG
jgi:hypothetical protein